MSLDKCKSCTRARVFVLVWVLASAPAVMTDSFGEEPNSTTRPPGTSVVVVAPALENRNRGLHRQLSNVATPIANHYVTADSISLALAIVPDPLVPRYRRLFDLNVLALQSGMLKDGYLLDRFVFPWSEELRRDTDPEQAKADTAVSNLDAGLYGLMIFRCDAWRGESCNYPGTVQNGKYSLGGTVRIRALYIVTETATSGVARHQFECAIRSMEAQTKTEPPAPASPPPNSHRCPEPIMATADTVMPTLLQHSLCAVPSVGNSAITILGPNFSGAISSIGETINGRVPNANRQVCLVSSSATESTNAQVESKYASIKYVPLALDNQQKLRHLAELSDRVQPDNPQAVAILAEASTFGYGICHEDIRDGDARTQRLCLQSPRFFFPPNVADIAHGLYKQEAQQASDLANATREVQNNHHVSLEAGAENGSEFPASESPAVTSASNQLQLDRVMDLLSARGPKIVVVAATDVRDRLFLFEQLREKLPRAMLVDLEADNLLAHPEYLHASRGALAMASANLDSRGSVFAGCDDREANAAQSAWSIDSQVLLADNTAHLYETDLTAPSRALPCGNARTATVRQAALQLVTYHGFNSVSDAFPSASAQLNVSGKPSFHLLILTELMACLFCMTTAALWLWPWTLQKTCQQPTFDSHYVQRKEKIYVIMATGCCVVFLPLALIVAYDSTGQMAHGLIYWLVTVELLGLFGVWRCYTQIRSTLWASRYASYSSLSVPAVLAILAVGLALATAWISQGLESDEPLINTLLLNEIGFDLGGGLAFYLVAAVAGIVTLSTSAILATRIFVVRRNFRLLVLAQELARQAKPNERFPWFVPRDESNQPVHTLHGYKPLPKWIPLLVSALIVVAASAPGLLDYMGGPRLTVFGSLAARVAVLALAATTLCASILLTAAYGAGRRVIALSGYVRSRLLDIRMHGRPLDTVKPTTDEPESETPGLWSGGAEMPNSFPATPVLAMESGAGKFSSHIWTGENDTEKSEVEGTGTAQGTKPSKPFFPSEVDIFNAITLLAGKLSLRTDFETAGKAWATELWKILFKGETNSRARFSLFTLLVSELSLFRWIAGGTVACAFASVGIVFLYPIEADTLLIFNLVILALAGLLCAYFAVVFERDGVLSNVVCNRAQKAEISIGLFSFIASPFVALAAAIALVEIPGVVDWAGGLFVMMRSLGIHP